MVRIFPPGVLVADWQAAADSYDQTAAKGKKFSGDEAGLAFHTPRCLRRPVAGNTDENFVLQQRGKERKRSAGVTRLASISRRSCSCDGRRRARRRAAR
jgi:hypothetical protein